MKSRHLRPEDINPNRGSHKINVAVEVILLRNNEILMTLRKNTAFEDGKYGFPSGHVELHEMPVETAVREAKEEVGVNIDPVNLKFVYANYRINKKTDPKFQEYLDLFFVATEWQGEPINAEPHKCEHIKWFDLTLLPSNIVFYLPKMVQDWQKGVYYSEYWLP